MRIQRTENSITINGKEIKFDQRVAEIVGLDDRALIELNSDDFAIGDPLVGRNILAFDANGEMLWRIPATGVTRTNSDGSVAPEAFFGLWRDDDGKVKTGTPNGFDWELDLDTGTISNPVFTK